VQISSLIDIIDGRLLNQPSISFIYSFKTDPSKVKEGDLFIAKKIDDVQVAVENGAFAVILESLHPIIDEEIAWIKVSDINKALIQLTRFKLAHFDVEAYYCDSITYDLLNIYASSSSKGIKFLSNDLEEFMKELDEIENNDYIFCQDRELLDKIYPNNRGFNSEEYRVSNFTEHSLFEVSFTYNDIYFPKLKLASIYIPQFISVYNFINEDIDLSKLKNLKHFKPLFLDKNLEITEFGKSDKFLISQTNDKLLVNEINYLENSYKYGKSIYITSTYNTKLSNKQIIVDDLDKLKDILKNNEFNCAYIIGYSLDQLNRTLEKLEKQFTLF